MTALNIQNVSKIYKQGIHALQDVSLVINDGDFFALLGPNGAGKSTLIGIITSLIRKTSGKISIYGHDLDSEQQLAKLNIGLVPQEINFNPTEKVLATLIKQAGFYGIDAKFACQKSEHYLHLLSLWEKKDFEIRNLSGGQKRRLLLARALIHDPRLLILDEPTAGVDFETRRFIWQFLRDLNEHGMTIILTTHYLEEAEHLCKNMAFIDGGKIIAQHVINHLYQDHYTDTILLHLDKPVLPLFTLKNFNCSFVNPTTLEVYIDQNQTINELFNELAHHRLNVIWFQNKTNKLEQLFASLTSKEKHK